MPDGTLEILLISAHGLKRGDFFSKTDAYAIIHCGKQSQKSNVARNQGSNPVWNQRFVFSVEAGVDEIFIKIMDEDFFTADDELGTVTIPLADVFRDGKVPSMPYNVVRKNGKYKGEVKLLLEFTPAMYGGIEGSIHSTSSHRHSQGLYPGRIDGSYGSSRGCVEGLVYNASPHTYDQSDSGTCVEGSIYNKTHSHAYDQPHSHGSLEGSIHHTAHHGGAEGSIYSATLHTYAHGPLHTYSRGPHHGRTDGPYGSSHGRVSGSIYDSSSYVYGQPYSHGPQHERIGEPYGSFHSSAEGSVHTPSHTYDRPPGGTIDGPYGTSSVGGFVHNPSHTYDRQQSLGPRGGTIDGPYGTSSGGGWTQGAI